MSPIYDTIKKVSKKFLQTPEAEDWFQKLKELYSKVSIPYYYNPMKPIIIEIDVSNSTIGAVTFLKHE